MGCPAEPSEAENVDERRLSATVERRGTQRHRGIGRPPCCVLGSEAESRSQAAAPRRMLAVTQFFEDDDMAFVLDRMLTWTKTPCAPACPPAAISSAT